MSRSKKKKRPVSRRQTGVHSRARANQGTLRLAAVIAILVGLNLYVFLWRGGTSIPAVMEQASVAGNRANGLVLTSVNQGEAASRFALAAVVDAGQPGRMVRGKVVRGDSMGRILRREGLDATAADELIRALSGTLEFSKIRPGQRFSLRFDDRGRLVEFEFQISKARAVRATRNGNGLLKARQLDVASFGYHFLSTLSADIMT